MLVTAFAVWKVSLNLIRVIVVSLCLFWYIQFYFIDLSEALLRADIYRPYLVAFFVIITATVIFGAIVSLYNVAFRFVFLRINLDGNWNSRCVVLFPTMER